MQCERAQFDSWVRKICWRRDRLPTPVFLGLHCGLASFFNLPAVWEIPGLGRSPGEGKGYPLQYSGLENSMDCIVHGVSKSRTRLSDFHFHSDPKAVLKTLLCGCLGSYWQLSGVWRGLASSSQWSRL